MITQDEFVQLLEKYSGVMEVSTSTKLKMNKGGRGGVELNPFYEKDVRREKSAIYEVGPSYREKISEALKADGQSMEKRDEFGDKLPWGEYEVKDKVVAYNGKRYLRCYPTNDPSATETILVDGRPAEAEELEVINSYVPERSSSKKQEAAGITEEHRVTPLLFAFDNISYVVFNGTKYDIG